MAQLPSVTPYNVQVSGVAGAVTPGVSFGAQRRPDVAFQAQAQYQQTLSRALDRISNTLFGVAEKAGMEAGQQFVADQPADELTLQAMVSGNPEVIQGAVRQLGAGGSSMNVYSAAVNKARAIELSAYAEREGQKLIESLEAQVGIGTMKALDAINTFSNHVDGVSSGLAELTPDASFKYRATMATIGRSFINNVSSTELKRVQTINRAATEEAYQLRLNDINRELTKEVSDPNVFETITKLQENFLVNATVTVGEAEAGKYAENFKKDILGLQTNMAKSYLSAGQDPYKQYDNLRLGRTGNAVMDALMAPTSASRAAMIDAARKELGALETIREQQEKEVGRQSEELQAQFADASSKNDRAAMTDILKNLRTLDRTAYVKLKADFDQIGGLHAQRDNQMVVADLERKLNNPYGPRVTVNEVYGKAKFMTQSTFSRLINAAQTMEDQQIRIMQEDLGARIGMAKTYFGPPDYQRRQQEETMNVVTRKFIAERIKNPDLDVFEFLETPGLLDRAEGDASKKVNTELLTKVQASPYKTQAAFDEAIRKSQLNQNAAQAAELIRQRNNLIEAINQGLVDEQGKVIKGKQ